MLIASLNSSLDNLDEKNLPVKAIFLPEQIHQSKDIAFSQNTIYVSFHGSNSLKAFYKRVVLQNFARFTCSRVTFVVKLQVCNFIKK